MPCFAYGCALYLLHRRGGVPKSGMIAAFAVAGMALSASLLAWDGVTVLFGGLLILALGSWSNDRAGLMASRPAVYLGEVSYAVYMVCAPWQLLAVNLAAKATGAADNRLPLWAWLAVIAGLPSPPWSPIRGGTTGPRLAEKLCRKERGRDDIAHEFA